ncbi:hypothetical protein CLOP_g19316 [Closterium sp. NIES-67]|nr:hypothetical protein CLOP_g19316 [Closterium sp. NIES-67]
MAPTLPDAAITSDFPDADPFSSEDADFAQALEDDLWDGDEDLNSEDGEEAASTCQPEELNEPFMGAGRFGRAFVAGYYSSSERDLHEKQWSLCGF